MKPAPQTLSQQMRTWYEKGRKGMITVCETEGAPEAVKEAVRHWYEQGDVALTRFIEELEKIDGTL